MGSNTVGARRSMTNVERIKPEVNNRQNPQSFTPTTLKAHSDKVNGDTDVNIGPPLASERKKSKEDILTLHYYNSLQYTLLETGYPETFDRTHKTRTFNTKEQVIIAMLTPPNECMSILLEGGRQLPDAVHLVLSSLWISKIPSKLNPNLQTLLLHKAVTFGRGGATYIDEFIPPRRVTYLVNFFTSSVTCGQRDDGVEIEKDVDCPMSSSLGLSALIDDKLWTRCLMAEVGMMFPETLAFVYKPVRSIESNTNSIIVVEVQDDTDFEDIRLSIEQFLTSKLMSNVNKVVVKPSGPTILGNAGISFHQTHDVTSIIEAVTSLLMGFEQGETALIETFANTIEPHESCRTHQWLADPSLGFRVRATVCRDFDNKAVTTMINCSIAPKAAPIGGSKSACQTLDSTLLYFNVKDQAKRIKLEQTICKQSEAVLETIIKHEGEMKATGKRDNQQTELIGIDLVVTQKDDDLIPVGVEVNSHDCTIICQIAEFMDCLLHKTVPLTPSTATSNTLDTTYFNRFSDNNRIVTSTGGCMRPLVRTMITRSQLYLMKNKEVLVIGAGGFSKRQLWNDAEEYGIKITLVESNPKHFAADKVDHFIYYDFNDHSQDYNHAHNVANMFRVDNGARVDGCLTFWEDCGPLAAFVSELLGSYGTGYDVALIAKKKSETHRVLRTRQDDIPHWPRTYLYASETHHIKTFDTLKTISNKLSYPCILKLEHGSSAVGVVQVLNESELKQNYTEITDRLRSEESFPGVGLGHDNTMVIMDLLRGSEHVLDIVIFDKQLVAAFISDKGPTRTPLYTETAAVLPTTLPQDKQSQLVTAAYQCVTEIGLCNGTFNLEFIMTSTGPKLLEINGRMGGFYIRDWIKRLYKVDLMLFALMISCGIKPFVPKLPPSTVIMGIMLIPSCHGHILQDKTTRTIMQDMTNKGEIIWNQFEETSELHCDIQHEEPFGNIAVEGNDVTGSREKLMAVCNKLGITCTSYDVRQFTKFF